MKLAPWWVTAKAWSDSVKKNPAEHSALKRENGTNPDEEQRGISQICEPFLKGAVEDYRREGRNSSGAC